MTVNPDLQNRTYLSMDQIAAIEDIVDRRREVPQPWHRRLLAPSLLVAVLGLMVQFAVWSGKMSARMDGVERQVREVKAAIHRLEMRR